MNQQDYEKKVLETYCNSEGYITQIPTKKKKFEVLLRYVLKNFEVSKKYPEAQVNEILLKFTSDPALFRRALTDYKYMARQNGGGLYQVVGKSEEWVDW